MEIYLNKFLKMSHQHVAIYISSSAWLCDSKNLWNLAVAMIQLLNMEEIYVIQSHSMKKRELFQNAFVGEAKEVRLASHLFYHFFIENFNLICSYLI